MQLAEQLREKLMQQITNKDFLEMIRGNTHPFERLMTYYKCAIMEVETKFNVLNEEFSLQYDRNPIETIKSRLKSPDSIAEKINRKHLPFNVESIENNLADVAGVRVVCSFVEDIYLLASCLLEQDDVTLIERKDYIENPKPGGYRSLHLIIEIPIFLQHEKRMMKVEVQLRTIAMDFWASLEHKLRYKKDIDEEDAAALAKELRECADISANLDLRMEAVRNTLEEKQAVKEQQKQHEFDMRKEFINHMAAPFFIPEQK